MNSKRITWFWPFSFLVALGQLLLILTDNQGGPALGRFFLAIWTLWLPGVWLGNLLTKPGVRLLTRLPIQASCALAITQLALLARGAGIGSAAFTPTMLCVIAVVVATAYLFLPAPASSRRHRTWEAQEGGRPEPGVIAVLILALIAVTLLHLWAGASLTLRPDATDLIAAARASAEPGSIFPPYPFHELAGTAGYDTDRSLMPALIDLLSRLTHLPHDRVWSLLPALAAPLLLLALQFTGLVIFRSHGLALAGAVVTLILFTEAFSAPELRLTAFPDHFALIPFWTAIALFLDGLDRPHLPAVIAFALAAFAVFGIHFAIGAILLLVMILVGTWAWTSVDRFQEGVPLLISLWLPLLLFAGIFVGFRAALLGGIDPFRTPAQDLLVWGSGRWTLDPARYSFLLRFAAGFALVFLPTLLLEARGRICWFYLVVATAALPLIAFNPYLLPLFEGWLGGGVHRLPWMVPLGFVLVAQGSWAVRGIVRSEGYTWARFLVVAGLFAVIAVSVWTGANRFAYRGSVLAAERAAPPEVWRGLARAAADTLSPGSRILSEPRTASLLGALAPLHSVYLPIRAQDQREARHRFLAAREALRFQDHAPGVADSLRTAEFAARETLLQFMRVYPTEFLITNRLETLGEPGALWPAEAGRIDRQERWLLADSLRYREIHLGNAGNAYQVARPSPGAGPAEFLAAGFGPPRPPASIRFAGPRPRAVRYDTSGVAAGGTLAMEITWDIPTDATRATLDPRGYRVRAELWRLYPPVAGWRARVASQWNRFRDALAARPRGWGVEVPVLEGIPLHWWNRDLEATQVLNMSVPTKLTPGDYELRVRALPGPRSPDRGREGLVFLPREGPLARVVVYPVGVNP